jgi:hypothetical protein
MAFHTINSECHFSTALLVRIYCREPADQPAEWYELDRGPGFFNLPSGQEALIKLKQIDDLDLRQLVQDLSGCKAISSLDLSENRKITDDGLEYIKELAQLVYLNLSSCDITNKGLFHLLELKQLKILNLSYCHRLSDIGLRTLQGLPHLTYLDLQGDLKVSQGGLSKIRRPGLTIHR